VVEGRQADFARSGDPNGPGVPAWPAFELDEDKPGLYLSEALPASGTMTDAQFSTEHKCDFWANVPAQ
jgi:para-nitrobenzyl esterase